MSLATDLSDGIGGLKFVATAPPGVGRLCRIPFYLTSAGDAAFMILQPGALPAAANSSSTSPIIVAGNGTAGTSGSALLSTPQISWATLRIVGFEVAVNYPANPAGDAQVEVVCQDLKIGGGANLFVHEDYAPVNIYASGNDSFSGLRDYPLLKSPNTAQVTIAVFAATAGVDPVATSNLAAQQGHCLLSCNLVVEILQDDNYGSHIPGPYARKGAMVRRGGSFV
jgi:hypothetical protein